jgi:hypothetical protein
MAWFSSLGIGKGQNGLWGDHDYDVLSPLLHEGDEAFPAMVSRRLGDFLEEVNDYGSGNPAERVSHYKRDGRFDIALTVHSATRSLRQSYAPDTQGKRFGRQSVPPGVIVIDADHVLSPSAGEESLALKQADSGLAKGVQSVSDDYWGDLEIYLGGWHHCQWFGWFLNDQFPWVLSRDLGVVYCFSKEGNGLYAMSARRTGPFTTSPDRFPLVLFGASAEWKPLGVKK